MSTPSRVGGDMGFLINPWVWFPQANRIVLIVLPPARTSYKILIPSVKAHSPLRQSYGPTQQTHQKQPNRMCSKLPSSKWHNVGVPVYLKITAAHFSDMGMELFPSLCKMRFCLISCLQILNLDPYSKVHGANMGPIWVLSAPDGPHVGCPGNQSYGTCVPMWM